MNSETKTALVKIALGAGAFVLLIAGFMYKAATRARVERREAEAANALNYSSSTPAVQTPASRPVIGMLFDEFAALCGDPSSLTTLENARGKFTTLKYEGARANFDKGCYGTFTFDDVTLDSIYR